MVDGHEQDVYVSGEEYAEEQAVLFERLLNEAYAKQHLDELSYRRLMASVERKADVYEAMDHFTALYMELKQIMRDDIETRIVNGAEFIEMHGALPTAVKRYDKLCEDLLKIDGRWYGGRQGETEGEIHERGLD